MTKNDTDDPIFPELSRHNKGVCTVVFKRLYWSCVLILDNHVVFTCSSNVVIHTVYSSDVSPG